MTQQEWDEMTDQQKYDTILAGTWSIQARMGVDANAKVGDKGAAFTLYAMFSDKIQISDWCETKVEAAKEAASNVSGMAA